MPINRDSRYASAKSYTTIKGSRTRTLIDPLARSTVQFTGGGTHRVVQGETLESIAAIRYGDATKWWAIADANNISTPIFVPPPGTLLNIPEL